MTACKLDDAVIKSHYPERPNGLVYVRRREYRVVAAADQKGFLRETRKLIEVRDRVDHAPTLAQFFLRKMRLKGRPYARHAGPNRIRYSRAAMIENIYSEALIERTSDKCVTEPEAGADNAKPVIAPLC